MATEGDRDDTSLLSLSRETSTSGSRPKSRPCSPNRNHRLPTQDEVGTALQSTIEDLANLDLDTSVVVHLSNCPGALRKIKDLLPIHFYSWKLKNAEAALIYTLLHMFVLLGQYREMEGERVTYQDYVTQLKSRIAQLEDERMFEQQQEQSSGDNERHREELVRLRRENAALRQSNTKLQASQDQLYQINEVWARDYDSLTQKVGALTGSWSESWTNISAAAVVTSEQPRTPTHPPSLTHSSLAHYTPAPCTKCLSLQDEVNRQVKEYIRKCERLEKSLVEREKELNQKDRMIVSLDNENQAVQLQMQEIGDLQEAMRMKEQFHKLELQMKQKEKQFQDATSQNIYLQQQAHYTPGPCTKCLSLQDEVAQLNRQVKEYVRKWDRLEKSLVEREKELNQKDRMIMSLDNENQAVQLQMQEIGDLQEAMRMKEQFHKLELQMKQKEKQFQDATSRNLYLQQQMQEIGDLQEAVRMKEQFRKLELQMKQKEKQLQDATSRNLYLQQQASTNQSMVRKGDQPKLPLLLDFPLRERDGEGLNIINRIGTTYRMLGTMLLNDDTGATTEAIEQRFNQKASDINYEILRRWLQGGGKTPVTWMTLVRVLKQVELIELSRKIENSLL